jgi:pimeloyl-ACP methyl ester carboxylesterase
MKIVDRGGGTPIVVIPGVQGRWEWMKPGINALAQRARVVTFSLADEPSCRGSFDAQRGFECYVDQVRDALDAAGIERAAICGMSYGGLIAAGFAVRYPERTAALVMVSAVPPSWRPDRRVRFYLRAPRALMPLFLLASLRMYREIAAANSGLLPGLAPGVRHAGRALSHMFSPTRMARRVAMLPDARMCGEISRVQAPALVVTGEAALDRVVAVSATLEYARMWPHARVAEMPRTGHLGLITRPEAFASLVVPFVEQAVHDARGRRRVG